MSSRVIAQGKYNATVPTNADGQLVDTQFDLRGNLKVAVSTASGTAISGSATVDAQGTPTGLWTQAVLLGFNGATWDRLRTPNVFKSVSVAVVAGTPQAIWTPATGKKFRVMGGWLSLSVAGRVFLQDAATPALRSTDIGASVAWYLQDMGNGYLSLSANNALNVDVSAGGNVQGVVFGTEE